MVTISVTFLTQSRSPKGRLPEVCLKTERVRCPRAELRSALGRLRASSRLAS